MLKIWFQMLAVDGARYVVMAGGAYLALRAWCDRVPHRVIRALASVPQMRREVLYSAITVAIFALVGTVLWFGRHAGVFRIDDDASVHGWPYAVLSVGLLVVAQDTYFYWTHRAMHHRALFRRFHLVHHLSRDPSPWAAYAFAPAEAFVHAAFVPLVTLVVPICQGALFAFLAIMIARNVVGHLGVELAPAWFARRCAWSTTTTHHALHHHRPHGNYGLYFTWWDRAMGTTDRTYDATFAALTHSVRQESAAAR